MRVHLLIATALLVGAGIEAHAQAYMRGGITGGINLANAALEPDYSTVYEGATREMRLGPLVGATLEWGVTGFPIAFQPEVHFIEKGVKVRYAQPESGVDTTQDVRYSYVEFPVLARIPFLEGPTRAYAVIGPSFAFNTAARGLHQSTRGASTADYYDDVTRTDIGIDIGGGVEVMLTPGMYILGDLRYTHGLTDVTQPVDRGEETWYSRDIKIKAGIKWDLWQARR